ncbi:magnesium transporter CorA family protein [Rhodococcus sp. X156]|uniref:magnesium transporter CorA family protein n=1 Tax=Rhodococcus sp. X156 TaxID=2499145 RepID=UPI001F49E5AF|nr:magnesium transporter CorA family protein [Rhodococcus sp. X156]
MIDIEPGRACAQTPTRCDARTRLYRDGVLESEGFPVEQISDHLGDDRVVVWLDLLDPELDDLVVLSEEFGLHPLALEDAVHDHQRPKVDRYGTHLFLTSYGAWLDTDSAELQTTEVAAFVLPQALITVRKDDRLRIEKVMQRWDDNSDLAKHGVAFLLHGLLDFIVDGHFETVQLLDDAIEDLEDQLFSDEPQGKEVQRRSYELRKSLVLTRRVVMPMREVLNTVMRRDLHVLDEEMLHYFHDVYDHVLRATEWTESLRDLVTTVLDTHLTMQGNRLNEIMRRLTAWAAIIAIPTAITGFYGQNVPYPGFEQWWGFLCSLALMVGVAGGLFLGFRRKGWL